MDEGTTQGVAYDALGTHDTFVEHDAVGVVARHINQVQYDQELGQRIGKLFT